MKLSPALLLAALTFSMDRALSSLFNRPGRKIAARAKPWDLIASSACKYGVAAVQEHVSVGFNDLDVLVSMKGKR